MPEALNVVCAPTTRTQHIALGGGNDGDIIINKVANGFVIRIGCKVFVGKTWTEVSEGLDLYFKDRNAARQKYCEDEKVETPV